MFLRYALGAVILCGLSLLGLGWGLGDVGRLGWLYGLAGAGVGVAVVAAARGVELGRRRAERAARLCFLLALVPLVWGVLALLLGRDPVSTAEVSALTARLVLLFSAVPACAGFLLLSMRRA